MPGENNNGKRYSEDDVKQLLDKYVDEYIKIVPSRLDLKTRLCLMAAFIYGTADPEDMSVDLALEKAVEIENAADAKVRKMKYENPIPLRSTQRRGR